MRAPTPWSEGRLHWSTRRAEGPPCSTPWLRPGGWRRPLGGSGSGSKSQRGPEGRSLQRGEGLDRGKQRADGPEPLSGSPSGWDSADGRGEDDVALDVRRPRPDGDAPDRAGGGTPHAE